MENNELKELLQKNIELSENIYRLTKTINSRLAMAQVWGLVKFVLIFIIPATLAFFYLPPIIKHMLGQVQSLTNLQQGFGSVKNGATMKLDPSQQELLNKFLNGQK